MLSRMWVSESHWLWWAEKSAIFPPLCTPQSCFCNSNERENLFWRSREKKLFQFLSITIITNLFSTLLLVAESNRIPFQRKKFSPRLANWNNWQWWMDSLLNNFCIIWITIAKLGNISDRNLFYFFLRMSQNLLRWRQTSFSVGLGKSEW